MICRACNTKMKSQQTHCPNCGRPAATGSLATPTRKIPLAPSSAQDPTELELDEPVAPKKTGKASPSQAKGLSPKRVQETFAAEPALLEKGLRLHDDKRIQPGGRLSTDVGEIDLLAVDDAGALVVVLIADSEKGAELVSEILPRIGWVSKHIAKSKQEVRGLVLLQSRPEDLGYAAAAVASSVSFKTYRMSIVLEDIDI